MTLSLEAIKFLSCCVLKVAAGRMRIRFVVANGECVWEEGSVVVDGCGNGIFEKGLNLTDEQEKRTNKHASWETARQTDRMTCQGIKDRMCLGEPWKERRENGWNPAGRQINMRRCDTWILGVLRGMTFLHFSCIGVMKKPIQGSLKFREEYFGMFFTFPQFGGRFLLTLEFHHSVSLFLLRMQWLSQSFRFPAPPDKIPNYFN